MTGCKAVQGGPPGSGLLAALLAACPDVRRPGRRPGWRGRVLALVHPGSGASYDQACDHCSCRVLSLPEGHSPGAACGRRGPGCGSGTYPGALPIPEVWPSRRGTGLAGDIQAASVGVYSLPVQQLGAPAHGRCGPTVPEDAAKRVTVGGRGTGLAVQDRLPGLGGGPLAQRLPYSTAFSSSGRDRPDRFTLDQPPLAGPAWTLLHGGELQLKLQLWRPSCCRWVMSKTTCVLLVSGEPLRPADQGAESGAVSGRTARLPRPARFR
jgi:hypothetical protein